MNYRIRLLLPALLLLLGATSAWSQATSDEALTQKQIQAAKEFVETQRNLTLIENLDFTKEQSEAFWPLYEEYRKKIREIRQRKLTLVQEYSERYWAGTVNDEFANSAIKDTLKIQADTVKVRQRYWKKFTRILPATKAARFYQLENKMDAEVDFVLAGGVPLIESS